MENKFNISLRLISEAYDFKKLIPKINGYEILYNKKGDNITKSGSFKARSNVLVINDFYTCNKIDDENNDIIINKLIPIIETLSVIDVNDLTREIYITGTIEDQQFGFSINLDLINLLEKNKYKFSFSGISLWE